MHTAAHLQLRERGQRRPAQPRGCPKGQVAGRTSSWPLLTVQVLGLPNTGPESLLQWTGTQPPGGRCPLAASPQGPAAPPSSRAAPGDGSAGPAGLRAAVTGPSARPMCLG